MCAVIETQVLAFLVSIDPLTVSCTLCYEIVSGPVINLGNIGMFRYE